MNYRLHNNCNKINPLPRFISIFLAALLILYICAGLYVMAAGSRKILQSPLLLQKGLSEKLLRFHVVGNSDLQADQEVKAQVKEEVIAYLRPLLSSADSKQEAEEGIRTHIEGIAALVLESLREKGYAYPVQVSLAPAYFPIKSYGDITMPAGVYDSLTIQLGEAEGQNWWCILFPQLCFLEGTVSIVPDFSKVQLQYLLSEEEYASILNAPKKITYKSKLLEWLQNLF